MPRLAISFRGAGYLLPPEGFIGGRPAKESASVPVPEAPTDEDHGPVLRQDEVGGAGKLPDVQAVAEAASEQASSHRELRPRVLRPDTGHDATSRLWCDDICQHGLLMTRLQLVRAKASAANIHNRQAAPAVDPSSASWGLRGVESLLRARTLLLGASGLPATVRRGRVPSVFQIAADEGHREPSRS